METYVLDASALLVYFGFEPRHAAARVNGLLASASDRKSRLLISSVNWGEAYYVVWRHSGQAAAEATLRRIDDLPIELIDADREITKRAASLKALFGLDYADSFAAAVAQGFAAKLVAADRDFDKLSRLDQPTELRIEVIQLLSERGA